MMIRMARGIVAALALLFAALAGAADGGVRAWLDRDTMQLGESVTLNVESQGGGGQPDFSALDRDFRQLGTQSSRQVNIVNGATAVKTLWAVALEPKQEGVLTVPAITVGGAQTEPLTLTVLPQPSGAQGKPGDDIFVEVTADPLAPYVQQQIRYAVKLYFAFDLTDGNLGEPKADGLVVQRLGQDRRYVANIGERRYHVVERHYALIPEASGTLRIPALVFRGSALDPRDPTGFFNRGRAVSASSDAVDLHVRPRPAAWGAGAWLPAVELTLSDESDLPAEVRVGDPVTRTVRLRAQGLGYEQLPELEFPVLDGAEIYPDKSQVTTRDDGTWLFGERVRKFAVVPTRPGKLELPALAIRWWNTTTGSEATAVLPARTVDVLPAAAGAAPPPVASPAVPAATADPAPPPASGEAPAVVASTRTWQWVAIAGFGLWLATLVLWWRRSQRRAPVAAPATSPVADAGTARTLFLRAAALGELAGAERSLIAWARVERPQLRNVGEVIAELADDEQREALLALQRVRYADAPADGLGARLERSFRGGLRWRDRPRSREAASVLPALYPDR
ncbi:BatD family protein [Dokdonella koreensis]|uniref:BatD protein n=1 Tax=Dokdonella koreensis DS-123 TaxID=1300342 RepID=A0A160DVH9_9GAMM|nr:BatD family protein [Dokdonella koreensis]ANB18121.1 BatD protein [Dokdonella koreensis DS-123]